MCKKVLHRLSKYKHYIISFLIQIVIAGFFIHEWDGFVFTRSAQQFLHGITPYQTALQAPLYTFGESGQMWYAYPPLPLLLFTSTYAPAFYLFGGNEILGRIFLKLTFVLGTLLCAYLVYKFVAGLSSKENASKAEKLVLYNPFLIFIAVAWGMFDIWMVNFLLLSLLSLRQNRLGRAGIYFGLSVLVKPIPIIFAPVFLGYIWHRRRSIASPLIFGFSAAAICTVVCLPFFLTCSQGFINQVVGMHADRPPFGWSPLVLLNIGQTLHEARDMNFPYLSASIVAAISIALLATTIFIISTYCWLRREKEERGLLALIFLLILGFTLFNKGVSPQHFVVPMVLALVLLFAYSDYGLVRVGDIRRYYKFLVLPYLFAALLEGRHFLTFIPQGIAEKIMGTTGADFDSQLAASFPISKDLYYGISEVGHVLFLVPAVIMAVIIIYKSLAQIIPAISRQVSAYLLRVKQIARRELVEVPLTILGASLFVVAPVLAVVVDHQAIAEEGYTSPPSSFNQGDKLIGIFYYYEWDNSSNDPTVKCDSWQGVKLTPEEGYYTSKYAYFEEDIRQMKGAGIDFALLSYHDYYLERYIAFEQAAEEAKFHFAPMIELPDLEQRGEYLAVAPTGRPFPDKPLSLTNRTREEIVEMIELSLRLKNSPAFLRYEKKPVVFLNGVFHFYPGWSEEEKRYLAQSVVEFYQWKYECSESVAMEKISANWGKNITSLEDMIFYFYPQSTRAFYEPQNNIEQDWSEGFKYGWEQFWKSIQSEIERVQGKVFWVGDWSGWWQPIVEENTADIAYEVFDSVFLDSSSLARSYAVDSEGVLAYWESRTSLLSDLGKGRKAPIMATTMPGYTEPGSSAGKGIVAPVKIGERLSYDLFWEIALDSQPNIVLIASWNNYYEDSCIEPTVEFGELFLKRTEYWSSTFKAPIPLG